MVWTTTSLTVEESIPFRDMIPKSAADVVKRRSDYPFVAGAAKWHFQQVISKRRAKKQPASLSTPYEGEIKRALTKFQKRGKDKTLVKMRKLTSVRDLLVKNINNI